MKKVLVTGGGFIGSNLVNYLLKDPTLIVKSIDNNPRIDSSCTVLDIKDIKTLNFQPDIIYHLAAQSRVKPSFENPELFTEDNVMGTLAVLEYAKKHNCKVVYAGSSSKHHNPSTSPYAMYKYLGEGICKLYKESFNLEVEICRFYNVYGPGETLDEINGNVIGIWRSKINRKVNIEIVGDGEQRRDEKRGSCTGCNCGRFIS